MLFVAIRELLVLVLGCLVAWLTSIALADNRPPVPRAGPPHPLLALFVPIIFCLIRASLIDQSHSECTWARRVGYQVMIALALITLLFFEIGIGFFFGWPGIPLNAWIVVCSIGVGYIFLSCIAYLIDPGASSRLPNGTNADEWD